MAALTFDRVRPIDWPQLIRDLRRRGFTFRSLAGILQISRATLFRLQCGVVPLHTEGERIIALWCEVANAERGQAPTKSVR